jgi:hypothetical protein
MDILDSLLTSLWFLGLRNDNSGLINLRRYLGAPDSLRSYAGRSSLKGLKGRPLLSRSFMLTVSLIFISTPVLKDMTKFLHHLQPADMVAENGLTWGL